ncbi:Uncharacterised protein [Bordetella pertussis]|nr:Uncharacterised protein [Bordetella pertussis]
MPAAVAASIRELIGKQNSSSVCSAFSIRATSSTALRSGSSGSGSAKGASAGRQAFMLSPSHVGMPGNAPGTWMPGWKAAGNSNTRPQPRR